MSLKETTHRETAVTHLQTSLSLDIIFTMATIGQEQDHRSVLEYVPHSLYYSYATLPTTHLHTYYYFKKKIKNSYTCDTLNISAVIPTD